MSENFDGPAQSAATLTWTDDTSISGWYVHKSADPAGPITQYRVTSSGSSTGIRLYLWRNSSSSTDFSLGSKPATDTGAMMMGMRISNNTGQTLTSFTIGYTGEQWYKSTATQNNQLVLAYQISPSNDADDGWVDGAWTEVDDMRFNSPKEDGVAASIDGNDAENRVVLAPKTVTGISWGPGEDIWLRWFDSNSSGVDQGLAVDDISFTANIPEPASMSVLVSTMMLAMNRGSRR
ncbi:hypothetical protein [Poriferisphaera sp. WC338]|uniref:hypothetical protein n=1 Tax=Poriferisphaera sp. WC338 TaxID=3425129 RepID=UPI003D817F04